MAPIQVFYSYSHVDEPLQKKLQSHLASLEHEGLIGDFHDRKIVGGQNFASVIDSHLDDADIILLLVSPDFLNSAYCREIEMRRALERHASGAARVIPIILRPTDWKNSVLGGLQALPRDGLAVTSWANQDEALLNVAEGLRQVVIDLRASRGRPPIETVTPEKELERDTRPRGLAKPWSGRSEKVFPRNTRPVGKLVGRGKVVNRLLGWLNDEESEDKDRTACVIRAQTGIGKSALAWRIFKSARPERWAGRLWWRVYENETFEPFLDEVLDYIGIQGEERQRATAQDKISLLMRELASEPYLIVIDGFERAAQSWREQVFDQQTANIAASSVLEEFLKLDKTPSRVIFTTQPLQTDWTKSGNIQIVDVDLDPLDDEDAEELFKDALKRAGKDRAFVALWAWHKTSSKHPVALLAVAGLRRHLDKIQSGQLVDTLNEERNLSPQDLILKVIIPRLSQDAQQILRVIAIINTIVSESVLIEILADLPEAFGSSLDSEQSIDALRSLAERFLVTREFHGGADYVFVHGIVSQAAYKHIPDKTRATLAKALFARLIAAKKHVHAYNIVIDRLNAGPFQEKYSEERLRFIDALFEPDANGHPDPASLDWLFKGHGDEEVHNKIAVTLATRAAGYLWTGQPRRAIEFLGEQIWRRNLRRYRAHEEKARSIRAYTLYLCGRLADAHAEASSLSGLHWTDRLPEMLVTWIDRLRKPGHAMNGVDRPSLEDFRQNFGPWTRDEAKNTVFKFEYDLRRQCQWAYSRQESSMLKSIDDSREKALEVYEAATAGEYSLIQAESALILARCASRHGRGEEAEKWASEAWTHAHAGGDGYVLEWVARGAEQILRERGISPAASLGLAPILRTAKWVEVKRDDRLVHFANPTIGDIWLAWEDSSRFDFLYGGCRVLGASLNDTSVEATLFHLLELESGIKNRLVNLGTRGMDRDDETLPRGLVGSRAGGARCVIRLTPAAERAALRRGVRLSSEEAVVAEILACISEELNRQGGRLQLTPDFGTNASLADMLHDHTENVLGVECKKGGSGGKSAFTVAGITALVEELGLLERVEIPVTVVGANGSLGQQLVGALRERGILNMAVCDLDEMTYLEHDSSFAIVPAEKDVITPACLARPGVLFVCCYGGELERSKLESVARGTAILLCENMAFSADATRRDVERSLASRDVRLVPGQLLTIGGVAVSRFEYYWRRQHANGGAFDKQRALAFVRQVQHSALQAVNEQARRWKGSLYDGMMDLISQ